MSRLAPRGPGSSPRRRSLVASLLVVVAFAFAFAPRLGRADDALARQHFRRGVELYDKKQYRPALEWFEKAYAEKPSPGIKQNVALCLRGLGRPVDAATAFDEALDEGQATLKPEVRGAMERELAELSKIVATVRLRIVSSADSKSIETAVVTVDGQPRSPAALRRPLRLEPGIHVFTAHVEGLADPPEKRLSILAGAPVEATFEIGVTASGMLTILPSVPDAVVQVDGVEIARSAWPLRVPAGKHRVSVTAPGHPTTSADVVVSPGAVVEYPIVLLQAVDAPPAYPLPRKPPAEPRRLYMVPMLAYEGQSMRLSPVLGERVGGSKRNFTGGAIGVRGGYRVSKNFAPELLFEIGQTTASYTISDASAAAGSSTKVIHWQVTPGLRFTTAGAIRFTAAMGLGAHGMSATAELNTWDGTKNTARTVKGSGVSASWLADIGVQFDVGSLFLEAVGFADVHGVGTTRDDATNERLFLSSPSTRVGARIGLGIPF